MEKVLEALGKAVEVVKDLPGWFLAAFAVSSGVLLFVPAVNAELPKDYRPWLFISLVVFAVLTIFKWIASLASWLVERNVAAKTRKKFHASPNTDQSFWAVATQPDGSLVTQIAARFAVKNLGAEPLGLMSARVIKPRIKGEVLSSHITVREQHGHMHGSATTGHRIAPGTTLPASAHVMIRGVPRSPQDKDLDVVLGIYDEDGQVQHVRMACRGRRKPQEADKPIPLEPLGGIADPIAKDVASVLQAEVARYELNGRPAGGLGSIHVLAEGRDVTQFGTDVRVMNSTANQEILLEPSSAHLRSDNLEALLALYGRLKTEQERDVFVNALLDRLQQDTGYAAVAYLIVCTLWKIGLLGEALTAATFGLEEGDRKTFGLSNALMLINGLLRYQHHEFSPEALDAIERFLQGLEESPFRIPQKIAAVRALRVMQPP